MEARRSVDVRISVGEATGIAGAEMAATVWLPEVVGTPAVVCFAFPGGGYARRYFSFEMPGAEGGDGEAGYHADRGWVFVTVDNLGVGESTSHAEFVTYETHAAAGDALVTEIVRQLASGDVGNEPIVDPTILGMAQSMGCYILVVQQAHRRTFDGIAVLGASAIHTVVPTGRDTPPVPFPWIVRSTANSSAPVILNAEQVAQAAPDLSRLAWAFHFDDEPMEVVAQDMASDPLPPWKSATVPSVAGLGTTPGQIASEAASVTVPVFVGVGERDVVPNPWLEPFAYRSSNDITLFVCPRMAHMHNFASTRERLWHRLQHWGDSLAAARTTA